MATKWQEFEQNESKVQVWIRQNFVRELALIDRLMDLHWTPLDFVNPKWQGSLERTVTMTLIARIFNDLEAARALLLSGLHSQVNMSLRDALETALLVKLFEANPQRSIAWMAKLLQLGPAQVRTELQKLGVLTPEYDLYGFYSQKTHPNFPTVASLTKEQDHESGGVLRTVGFGSKADPGETATTILSIISVGIVLLRVSLAPIYLRYSGDLAQWVADCKTLTQEAKEIASRVSSSKPPSSPEGELLKRKFQPFFDGLNSWLDE